MPVPQGLTRLWNGRPARSTAVIFCYNTGVILGKDGVERLPPPVGTSDWVTFSCDSYCVDKTLMIKELIDTKTRVALFTRPGASARRRQWRWFARSTN